MTEGPPSVPPPNAQPAAPFPPPPAQPGPGPSGPPAQAMPPGASGPPAQAAPPGPFGPPAQAMPAGTFGPTAQAAPPGPYGPMPHPPAGPYGPPAYPPPGPGQFGPPGPYGPPPLAPPPAKKSRRGLWIGLGAGALAVLVLCVGAMFGLKAHLDEKNAASAAALDEKYNPIKPEEIENLLAEHTRALKERDLKAFVAPFDPAKKDLVARQTSLFQNLVKLPLAEGRFERVVKSEFKPVGASGFTFDLTVSFVHKFEGYDLLPVEELYQWTVVRTEKGAPLKITAAGGLPSERKRDATTYYPAPWDKWRTIHVERTPHALLIVDASLRAEAQRYAPIAEQAAVKDLAAWRAGGVAAEIPQGFVISLVKGKKELGSLYRTTKETPTESGVAIGVPPYGSRDEDQGPDIGGSRVVIDAADEYHFTKGNRARQSNIFRHELAHAIAHSLTDRAPDASVLDEQENWVVEGFAEYLGHDRKPWTTSERAGTGRATLRSLNYDLPLPSNPSWDMEGRGSYHYWLAHSAIGYIAERYGEQKVFQLVAEHYRGKKIEDVTQDVLGVSYADFADQWASYVKSKVR